MSNQPGRKNQKKVCIIGAGPAGLAAAQRLKEKGYQDVIILEKDDHAGGKCRSFTYQGQPYELGAVLGTPYYTSTIQFMNRINATTGPVSDRRYYDLAKAGEGELIKGSEKPSLLWQLFVRYRRMLFGRYNRINNPGFDHIDPELYERMDDWAEKKNLKLIVRIFEPPATTFGYGYFDEIPAAYYVKYLDWPTIMAFRNRKNLYTWKDGVQNLWEKVAQSFDVRYNTKINSIKRFDKVSIKTDKETIEADELIVTCPLDATLDFMDSTKDEKALFSKIQYCDYRVFACTIDDLPRNAGYIMQNFKSPTIGHPMLWYNRYPEVNFYTVYVLGDWKMTNEQIERNIAADLGKLGGKLKEIYTTAQWHYFPHVGTEELQTSYYEKLEALQGKNHTYLGGEIMNFSTVEFTCRYSEYLVDRFF